MKEPGDEVQKKEGRVHIIAEAGTNHCGKYEIARKLVDVAAEVGADSIKFQIIHPEELYLPKFYKGSDYVNNEVFKKRASSMLNDDEYRRLSIYAREKELPFSASVFDVQGLNLLDEIDPPYIKIASCDLNNSNLLKPAAEKGRRLIVSTGMASLREIEKAIADIVSTGNQDLVLMHCVSIYPCPLKDMNLSFLDVLRYNFGFPVGLSDHTEDSIAASIGVSMGCDYIEKHFTLNRKLDGFDHAYAMEPSMLAKYTKDIRAVESACKKPKSKVSEQEEKVKQHARRSIYARYVIPAGTRIQEEDLLIVRPEGGLEPNDLPLIINKIARRNIQQYEPLSWEILE